MIDEILLNISGIFMSILMIFYGYTNFNRSRKEFKLPRNVPYDQLEKAKKFVRAFDGNNRLPQPQTLEVIYNNDKAENDPRQLSIVVSLDFDTILRSNPLANHTKGAYGKLCEKYTSNLYSNLDMVYDLLKEIYHTDINTLYETIDVINIGYLSNKYLTHVAIIPSYICMTGTMMVCKTKYTETRFKEMYFRR